MKPFTTLGRSKSEVLTYCRKYDPVPLTSKDLPSTFLFEWTRTHAEGRKENYSLKSFDSVGVDYLDYILGAYSPWMKKSNGKYNPWKDGDAEHPIYCHIWWRVWWYSTYTAPHRFSLAHSSRNQDKNLDAEEKSLEASLKDVMHYREVTSPDWDDEDFDPAYDDSERKDYRIKRNRHGDVYVSQRDELHSGAQWIKVGVRKPITDDDPSPFITIGVITDGNDDEETKDLLEKQAQWSLGEGLRGYGEPNDEYLPPLALRWKVLKNIEARGTRIYRHKRKEEVQSVEIRVNSDLNDILMLPVGTYTTVYQPPQKSKYVIYRKDDTPIEMIGSEWCPQVSKKGDVTFIRKDLHEYSLIVWNKLLAITQLLREERWITLVQDRPNPHATPTDKEVDECRKLLMKTFFDMENDLQSTEKVWNAKEEKVEIVPLDFGVLTPVLLGAIKGLRKLMMEKLYSKKEEIDLSTIFMMVADKILDEWEYTPTQLAYIWECNSVDYHI